ncbi:DNA cytosine methyltransferase [Paenibacillus naphthalenovorans]|uniref:DNA cytosine methyltransferase n=1 Tax=Paenibacillus naphthalenovorans TaxID=162209 RepID=UPI003D274849
MCIHKTHGATTSIHHDKTGTLQAARLDKVPMVVEEPRAVLTPDRVDKRQNGRRMKEPGEPMFTLTAQDLHGVALEVESGLIHSRGFETRKDGLSHCLKGAEGGSSKNFLLEKSIPSPDDVARTVRSGGHGSYDGKHTHGFLNTGCRIRKLTPRECWRLQGFPDWAFDRAKYYTAEEADLLIKNQPNRHEKRGISHEKRVERMSDSQLYKQAGNTVTVNVIYAIARELG